MAKVKLGNVKGSKGDKGDRGSLWRVTDKMTGQSTSDTAFPGAGFEDSAVGDMCLNPITCDIYKCTAGGDAATAKWVWVMNNRGPQGEQGPKGDPTTVDAVLSKDSVNPIQNKAVATKFQDVQDSLTKAALNVSTGLIDDDAFCKTHGFVGVYNGFNRPPLFGDKQMFLVVNSGTGGTAYQIAYAYNDRIMKSRKNEGDKWGSWL